MLQFWKKLGDNDKNLCTQSAGCANPKVSVEKPPKPPLKLLRDDSLIDIDEYESTRDRSKLCRSLQEVLGDKGALTYFLQFMESRGASSYILCYLDIVSFKAELGRDHDSLSVSTGDSFTDSSDRVTQNSCDQDLSDSRSLEEVNVTESAVNIFKKYIAQEAAQSIKCSDLIRNEIIENLCDSSSVLTGNCFSKVQDYCFETTKKEFFEAFLGSDFFCKYQIDILTGGSVALDDILHNETALFYFMEFLEQENSSSLLEFWIAATNLQQHLHNQKEFFDPFEAQTDAVVLYDKYFSLQALCPLGFGDRVRFDIEQNICGENGLIIDCFHVPLKLVEQVLDRHYLKPFLASQLFYKYLSELISTVSNSNLVNYDSSRPLYSDCSSERSFSTNSAFLALEINGNNAAKKRDKGADMSIDTRQLCDPDSLWKRKRSHRLSCGRITALGKFETDLEPEPDKNGFKLRNVVRKFVALDEDKKKEEMAWQVAEMIVKDITSVTLQEKSTHS